MSFEARKRQTKKDRDVLEAKKAGLWYNVLVTCYKKGKHEADAVSELARKTWQVEAVPFLSIILLEKKKIFTNWEYMKETLNLN